jgi:hypothetical protein
MLPPARQELLLLGVPVLNAVSGAPAVGGLLLRI